MQLSRIPHYVRKIVALGPRTSFVVAKNRMQAAWHEKKVRRKAQQGRASHTWEDIAQQYGGQKSFSQFWYDQKQKSYPFIETLYDVPADQVIAQANLFEQKTIDLLGSGHQQ